MANGSTSVRLPSSGNRYSVRKEVIQPQVLLRLPCYDFTPITNPTFGRWLLTVTSRTSNLRDYRNLSRSFDGLTGYNAFFDQEAYILSGDGDPERLFAPFVTSKPPGEGTGLGLAISRQLAEREGGRLEAANHPEGGAVFTLVLPRHPCDGC